MPKLEPKVVQKELEQGYLWPVYWLYGSERMKIRELLRRIRKAVLGDEGSALGLGSMLSEDLFDATDLSAGGASAILDAAQSSALGGGLRLVIVREAHALKEPEVLASLFGPRVKTPDSRLVSVCVFLSKDLDGRKKFSKALLENAAVVACEEVPEAEREAWVQYLAKRRGLNLEPRLVTLLSQLDPWSLDSIDQELEKYSIGESADVIFAGAGASGSLAHSVEGFLDALLTKNLAQALKSIDSFADSPDESLPLLGLLAWNVRHLALLVAERESGTRSGLKLSPYVAERLQRWGRHWKLSEILELQQRLEELDYSLKQTPLLPLGAWAGLVLSIQSQ
ncbi:MAG: hypothetical protein P4M08_15490 [Oligoflexia bacterium]|nr:hypothetical protein [Oligoflexia bacterium]